MAELTDREREYAKKVEELHFGNATFNKDELLEYTKKIGYQAVHKIMLDLLADNVERHKKSIPLVGLRMSFRKRAGKFDRKQQQQIEQDNKKLDWEAHLKLIEAEQAAGFCANSDQLFKALVTYSDSKDCSADAYQRGLKFLKQLRDSKVEKPVDQTVGG